MMIILPRTLPIFLLDDSAVFSIRKAERGVSKLAFTTWRMASFCSAEKDTSRAESSLMSDIIFLGFLPSNVRENALDSFSRKAIYCASDKRKFERLCPQREGHNYF